MAEQLASVPEETATGFPAPYPPSSSYLESIRSVDAPQWRIRSTPFPQSSHSGSSYSSNYSSGGSSNTNMSNNSGCSSGLLSAGASSFGAWELTMIAQKMVRDGYILQMVQAFGGQNPDRVLEAWFVELDVAWVFQHGENHGSQFQLQPQELLEKYWIRSLTLIVLSIEKLVAGGHVTPAVVRFGKASISAMFNFVHIFNLSAPENLQSMLLMYTAVSTASYEMNRLLTFCSKAQSIYSEIGGLLAKEKNKLIETISAMINEAKVKAFSTFDASWDIEILQIRGDVHRSVRLLMDYIVFIWNIQASSQDYAQSYSTRKLRDLTDDTMGYLKTMILKKSEMCLDPSLRYIFLLNNINFVLAKVPEPSISLYVELLSVQPKGLELTPECEKHMDSYLEVSWGHVLSYISTSKISGPLRRWNTTSSLAKFQSAFDKTYQAQKFWKVPDPYLRSALREAITKRVISAYRDYLKEHPELEKDVGGGSSHPDVLEEMVGELFEG